MTTISRVLAAVIVAFSAGVADAGSFAFPALTPEPSAAAPSPAWLDGGIGDDGYVTIQASISMPDGSCKGLGSAGWLFDVGKEAMQIVVSIKTSGISANLAGKEIPIAIFDGRSNPGGCAVLSALPMTIVPFGRLEKFSAVDPGNIVFAVNVTSTTEVKENIIGAAQTLLGAAAVFATGGAAVTIKGLTSELAKPALSRIEEQLNIRSSKVAPNEFSKTYTWADIRMGMGPLIIPVYLAKADRTQSVPDAMAEARVGKRAAQRIFDVTLKFSYRKSFFDASVSGKDDLPKGDSIAPLRVLNHPGFPDAPNFLTKLNDGAPSLLQVMAKATSDGEIASLCGKVIEKLEGLGLNLLDRAIVAKAFMDEAKKDLDWYSDGKTVESCFGKYDRIKSLLPKLFGAPKSELTIHDLMKCDHLLNATQCERWAVEVGPLLADFRRALNAGSDRTVALMQVNGGTDFEVQVWGDGWELQRPSEARTVSTAVEVAGPTDPHPGVSRIAQKKLVAAGCFLYGRPRFLNSGTPGGYMVLEGDKQDFWVAQLELATNGTGRITKIGIQKMDKDWKSMLFSPGTVFGKESQCDGIKQRIQKILA